MPAVETVELSPSPPPDPKAIIKMGLQMTPEKERPGLLAKLLGEEEAKMDEAEDDAGVNNILDELLREIPVEKGVAKGKRQKKVPVKKATGKAANAVVKKEGKPAAKPRAGNAKKRAAAPETKATTNSKFVGDKPPAKKKKAEPVPESDDDDEESSVDDSGDDDDDSSLDSTDSGDEDNDDDDVGDEEEEEESDDGTSDNGEEEEEEEAGGNRAKKRAVRVMKGLTAKVKLMQLAQCKECQAAQKKVDSCVSAVAHDELFLNVCLCRECIDANIDLGQTITRYFGAPTPGGARKKLFVEEAAQHVLGMDGKKKKKMPKFKGDTDDYKAVSARYVVQIGQCGECVVRQKLMNPELFLAKGPDGTKMAAFCQCLKCLAGNKQAQQLYWKQWSLFAQQKSAKEKAAEEKKSKKKAKKNGKGKKAKNN